VSHPNLTPIEGIAARLDVASRHAAFLDYTKGTLSPGPGLLISSAVAEACLPGIIGMGVNALTEKHLNFEPYTLNPPRRKVGFIREASIDGDLIRVKGLAQREAHPEAALLNDRQDIGEVPSVHITEQVLDR
jgi:hypothetical protein